MYIDSGFPVGFFVLVFAVIIVAVILSLKAQAARRKELAALAEAHGWQFHCYDPFKIPDTFSFFDCINQGHSHDASNVLWGDSNGREFRAFDYTYKTGSGKEETTHHLSALILDAPFPLEPLQIRPENFMDRIAGAIGFEDIDFEWDEFNRAFYVKAADKQFAYDIIHQKMMEFLMAYKGWSLEVFAKHVIVYNDNTFNVADFLKALEFAESFVGQLPAYLEDRLRTKQDGV